MVKLSHFPPFRELTGLAPRLTVVDAGSSPAGVAPPYAALLGAGTTRVIRFVPPHAAPAASERCESEAGDLPRCLGDGMPGLFHLCRDPGFSSLREPDPANFALVGDLRDGSAVLARQPVPTVRLDDAPEALGLDLLRLDLRGSELDVLRNGVERLRDAAVLHVAVAFLPLYRGQPLFGDVDLFLRAQGWMLHRFDRMDGHVLHPPGSPVGRGMGPSQLVSADAVYIRDLTRLGRCPSPQLVATAAILHDGYGSVDVALRLLVELDRRSGTAVAADYLAGLQGRPVARAA